MQKGLLIWCCNPSIEIKEYLPQQVIQFLNNNTPQQQLRLFTISYGIQMPNWRLMIEIILHSNDDWQTYKNNNRAYKCQFVDIANVRISLIRGYNVENARDWKICNKGSFEAIAKAQDHTRLTNIFRQRMIHMHRELMRTHSNAQERTGAHGNARE